MYGFNNPCSFQIEAINHLAFNDDSSLLVLISRTEDGKSLVPLTVSVLRGGVTLVLVSLYSLRSDQVDKAEVPEHGIMAYYVDKHTVFLKVHENWQICLMLKSANVQICQPAKIKTGKFAHLH